MPAASGARQDHVGGGDSTMIAPWTYRRDRLGERWHIVPAGEHGIRGRALCGEPRQGTRLFEGHAETEPGPPELMC